MIKIVKGNLLKCDAEALVNTVNIQGIMGKGVALQFKKAYPDMFKEYAAACKKGIVKIGYMHVYKLNRKTNPRFIINFPTKKNWRNPSKLEYIEQGLHDLIRIIKDNHIKSIALPPLGCGFGGLAWKKVQELINRAFANMQDIKVFLYTPFGAPKADQIINNTKPPKMTYERAVAIKFLEQYKRLDLDSEKFLTLLEIQKLLYFLQIFGVNLQLRFKKAYYGPYAENLRHVLNSFEGHFIQGYIGEDKPDTPIKLLPQGIRLANEFFINNKKERCLEKAEKFIDGFESPYCLELLATIHWLITQENINKDDEDAIIKAVHNWSNRKKTYMQDAHIKIALTRIQKFFTG